MIGIFEEVEIIGKKRKKIMAKVDTGAWRTSIDEEIAEELGLEKTQEKKVVKSSLGRSHRQIVVLRFVLKGREIKTKAFLANRKGLKYPMIIGRRDLKGFVIKVNK